MQYAAMLKHGILVLVLLSFIGMARADDNFNRAMDDQSTYLTTHADALRRFDPELADDIIVLAHMYQSLKYWPSYDVIGSNASEIANLHERVSLALIKFTAPKMKEKLHPFLMWNRLSTVAMRTLAIEWQSTTEALEIQYQRLKFTTDQDAYCCKVCTNSQACGNSCISWSYTCHKPPGCACQ